MAPALYPIASVDVAVALQRGGFDVTIQTAERLVLVRGSRRVVLRRGHTMTPPELLLLLRAAGVSAEEFLGLLGPKHVSGTRPRVTQEELADAAQELAKGRR